MDMKLAAEYGSAIAKKKQLEEQIREVSKEIEALQDRVCNMLQENQLDRLPVRVSDTEQITLYIHRQLWAYPKGGDREKLVSVLKRCGLGELVQEQYNTQTLSAYVRERLGEGKQLQPTLQEAVSLSEVVSVRGRKAAQKAPSQTTKAMRTVRRKA